MSAATLPVFTRGEQVAVALIDEDLHEQLSVFRWRLREGYAERKGRRGGELLHRVVLGLTYGDPQVDHRNRVRLDCRRENLRIASPALNAQNTGSRPGSTSRFRGVGWYQPRSCWQAYVGINGRQIKLGYRHDEVEAAVLAEQARRRLMPFAEPDPELVAALALRAAA